MRFSRRLKLGVTMVLLCSTIITMPVMAKRKGRGKPMKMPITNSYYGDETCTKEITVKNDPSLTRKDLADLVSACEVQYDEIDSLYTDEYINSDAYSMIELFHIYDLGKMADIAHEYLSINDEFYFDTGIWVTDNYEDPAYEEFTFKCSGYDFERFLKEHNTGDMYTIVGPDYKTYCFEYDNGVEASIKFMPDIQVMLYTVNYNKDRLITKKGTLLIPQF